MFEFDDNPHDFSMLMAQASHDQEPVERRVKIINSMRETEIEEKAFIPMFSSLSKPLSSDYELSQKEVVEPARHDKEDVKT